MVICLPLASIFWQADDDQIMLQPVRKNSNLFFMMELKTTLPAWLSEMVNYPPKHGINAWLYQCARQLAHHYDGDAIVRLLHSRSGNLRRAVTVKEIRHCVQCAMKVAWMPRSHGRYCSVQFAEKELVPKWPGLNHDLMADIAASPRYDITAFDWFYNCDNTMKIMDCLYPGNPLLCVGMFASKMITMPKKYVEHEKNSFIVPNAMVALKGKTYEDEYSYRSHSNACTSRSWLVVEFDKLHDTTQIEHHAYLSTLLPLVMIVKSGNKSIHGWYQVHGLSDDECYQFFRLAVSIGADPATFPKSQFVRFPNGYNRKYGEKQRVIFFDESLTRR